MQEDIIKNEKSKEILEYLKPLIQGVADFLSDENVNELSKIQLVKKIGDLANIK